MSACACCGKGPTRSIPTGEVRRQQTSNGAFRSVAVGTPLCARCEAHKAHEGAYPFGGEDGLLCKDIGPPDTIALPI